MAGVLANPSREERVTSLLLMDVASEIVRCSPGADTDALAEEMPLEDLLRLRELARDVVARLQEHGL